MRDDGVQIAVIVNDMAEVNIDAAEVAASAEFVESKPHLVELSNGCVCCTLRGDLIEVPTLDYLVCCTMTMSVAHCAAT